MFAQVWMQPGGWISWIIVGLIAGWLAGLVMRGGGYGIVWDLILGLIGALVGGFVFGLFMAGDVGFWGSIGIAFIGACILVAIGRALTPTRTI
jgi:uncharacterized membrane protein YeaQ/YmgE (transglycosylase-associated protein family)